MDYGWIINNVETCEKLWEVLQPVLLRIPDLNMFLEIADGFEVRRQLPHCIGPIDGRHMRIPAPESGSLFYNYKGYHSIVLMAACDVNYMFTMVDVGALGSQSDGGVFDNSVFGTLLRQGRLGIPPPSILPGVNPERVRFPFYLNGDAAFPLHENIMRPYPGHNLTSDQRHFNFRLSSARIAIEQTFGMFFIDYSLSEAFLMIFVFNSRHPHGTIQGSPRNDLYAAN